MLNVITSSTTIINPEVTQAVGSLLSLAFQTLLLLLVAGVTWGVKLGLASIKNGIVRAFARRAVAYAAQRLSQVSDEEKRKSVAAKIHAKFPRLSEVEVEHYLEEAYVSLKAGLDAAQ